MKKSLAFSLVELLISLIIISCVVAAFVPIMTKKMNASRIISNSKVDLKGENECKKFSSPEFIEGGQCPECGKCTLCDGDKRCIQCESKTCDSSKKESLDESTCRCISCIDTSNGFDENCLSCTVDACLECIKGQYPVGKKCVDCDIENCADCSDKKTCVECKPGYYLDAGRCKPCPAGYYSDSVSGKCVKCPVGSYNTEQGSPSCITCPDGTYNKEEGSISCLICPANFACKDGNIIPCDKANMSSPMGSSECKCSAGFHEFNNYCWPNITAINAGDPGGAEIPSGVQICTAGIPNCSVKGGTHPNYTYTPTCWKGTNVSTTGEYACTTANKYSGCDRTVCENQAAHMICASNIKNGKPMYLPSAAQWKALADIDPTDTDAYLYLLTNYNFCSSTTASSLIARCSSVGYTCYGTSGYGHCQPDFYWGKTSVNSVGGGYRFSGKLVPYTNCSTCHVSAQSVRCAWD